MESKRTDIYFANLPSVEIGTEIFSRVKDYDQFIVTNQLLSLWRRSWHMYYKSSIKGGRLTLAGEQGQYKMLNVNHYHSILQGLLNLVTNQRPTFEPQAANDDYKSLSQTLVAQNILEYYLREKGLERLAKDTAEKALVFGEAYITVTWNQNLGEPIRPTSPESPEQPTKMLHEGDLEVKSFDPANVIMDFTQGSSANQSWYCVRDYQNKWDLAASFPEVAEDLIALNVGAEIQRMRFGHLPNESNTDLIPVIMFFHDRTPAVPDGRFVMLADQDIILVDTPLPYARLPVYRISPSNKIGTVFGYTIGSDLLNIQEAIDKLYSIILTNQATFGVQNVVVPKGTKFDISQVVDGLNFLSCDMKMGVPTALNLTQTPVEIFNFIDSLIRQMEIISGLNSVARGDPAKGLESGTALAFVQSQALVSNSGLQQAYYNLLEDIGTGIISIIKTMGNNNKIKAIAGKNNQTYIKEYTGNDVSNINRVLVDVGNPLTRTTAGKLQIAGDLLKNGLVKTSQEYMTVLTTGSLPPIFQNELSELQLIHDENEMLMEGIEPLVTSTQNHPLHVKEHNVVINSLRLTIKSESDPVLVAAVQHQQEHVREMVELSATNPAVLIMLGIQPLMLPQPQQPPEQIGGSTVTTEPSVPSAPKLPPGTDTVTRNAAEQAPPIEGQ